MSGFLGTHGIQPRTTGLLEVTPTWGELDQSRTSAEEPTAPNPPHTGVGPGRGLPDEPSYDTSPYRP